MHRQILTLFFFNFLTVSRTDEGSNQRGFLTALENKFDFKFFEYANKIGKSLEIFNDKHLNNSDIGRVIRYNEIKTKLYNMENEARGRSHKLSLLLLPIIFHVGASSTWLMMTGILAAKSVAIGLLLLLFKIVVSTAKVASYVTAWKLKGHHHHGEIIAWPVHHEHHATHIEPDSYRPDWSSLADYRTIPAEHPEMEYSESRKVNIKHTPRMAPDTYRASWTPDYNTSPDPDGIYSGSKKINKISKS